jgi:hypothetical protein
MFGGMWNNPYSSSHFLQICFSSTLGLPSCLFKGFLDQGFSLLSCFLRTTHISFFQILSFQHKSKGKNYCKYCDNIVSCLCHDRICDFLPPILSAKSHSHVITLDLHTLRFIWTEKEKNAYPSVYYVITSWREFLCFKSQETSIWNLVKVTLPTADSWISLLRMKSHCCKDNHTTHITSTESYTISSLTS